MKRYNGQTNSYIRITPIHDIGDLYVKDSIETNLTITLEDFLSKLTEFEDNRKYNGNSRVFMLATFLLPENFQEYPKQEFLYKLTEYLFEDMPDVPWFATEIKQGKGTYINLYFSERPFYPSKNKIIKYAKSTTYKSSKTGRICKKDDPHAVIYKSKGEIISSSEAYFGKKYNHLWKKSFQLLLSEIRDIFDIVLSKFDVRADEEVFIHKVNYSQYNKDTKINAIIKNKKLAFIENLLNTTYFALKIGYFIQDKEIEIAFNELVYEIRNISKRDYIKYKHLKIPMNVFQDRYQLQNNLNYLSEVCTDKIAQFTKKYVGII